MKRKKKSKTVKGPQAGLFGRTLKKPETDDPPGRASKMGPPVMSGMPRTGKKLSSRRRKRLEGRLL